ncbi:hypothetical protein [Flavobacterium piscisymbiosum]|uniref:Lipoprotein n=1 Tax=Flavobacterium piscisymbiosum TaxID=2893753 RepID=A0ABS8MKD2_9FLAO|nr:hypothetical protein [Flavobacterium sp. F-30]MCC9065951.1 hypothetical protein [Flavobacterium sp. F-30]
MKKRMILVVSCFFLALLSCKKDVNQENNTKNNDEAVLVFPDTVYINEKYDGKIDYKSDLDTITKKFNDVKKARFIFYSFLRTYDKNYDVEYLKRIVKDTFVAETNKMIPLYNIKFDKLGLNFFDGIITDEVIIENGAIDKNGESMARIITHETRLTRGVYVIERKNKK